MLWRIECGSAHHSRAAIELIQAYGVELAVVGKRCCVGQRCVVRLLAECDCSAGRIANQEGVFIAFGHLKGRERRAIGAGGKAHRVVVVELGFRQYFGQGFHLVGAVRLLHQALGREVVANDHAPVQAYAIGDINSASTCCHLHQLTLGRAEVVPRGIKRAKRLHLAGLHIHRCNAVALQTCFRIGIRFSGGSRTAADRHDGSLDVHDGGTKGNILARLLELRPFIGIGVVREQELILQSLISTGSRKHQELALPQCKANRCVLIESIVADLDTRQASHSLPSSGLYAITIEGLEGKTRLKILVQGFELRECVDIAVQANDLGALNLIGEPRPIQGNRLFEQRNIALWRVLGETHNHRIATRFP